MHQEDIFDRWIQELEIFEQIQAQLHPMLDVQSHTYTVHRFLYISRELYRGPAHSERRPNFFT